MQDMHNPLPIRCCLFEAEGDFPQNIDTLVTVKKSRQVLEDYLMTSKPCKHVLQDRNFWLIFSSEICLRGMRWFVRFPGVTEAMTPIP